MAIVRCKLQGTIRDAQGTKLILYRPDGDNGYFWQLTLEHTVLPDDLRKLQAGEVVAIEHSNLYSGLYSTTPHKLRDTSLKCWPNGWRWEEHLPNF